MELPIPALSAAEIRARILVHQVPGVGPATLARLVEGFHGAAGALTATEEALRAVVGPRLASLLADRHALAERQRVASGVLERLGGWAVVNGAPGYPPGLLDLSPPPPVLYGRGSVSQAPAVAIVGTRRASGRARELAREMAGALCGDGYVVVSGGAYGIDAAAHAGALDRGGRTVVVFGGGLDRPYPDRHIALFERAAAQGAVLSPFRPGTPPVRGGFLARNGIIAALGRAVVVVEAGWRSGARSTALAALRLGRLLLAVPGSPGTGRLVAEGAVSVKNAADVLRHVAAKRGVSSEPPLTTASGAVTHRGAASPVLQVLAHGEWVTAEAVAEKMGLSPAAVVAELMILVLEGLVLQQPGGGYRRV